MTQAQMPHDLDAEAALLGSVMLDARAIDHLDPAAFYRREHRTIAEVMRELADRREPIDTMTLAAGLRARGELDAVGGMAALVGFPLKVPTADNAGEYAAIVRNLARRRAIIETASASIVGAQSLNVDPNTVIASMESTLISLREQRKGRGLRRIADSVGEAFQRLESMADRKAAITGVSTGLTKLDEMTAGLQDTDLVIVAGRPSMGKTSTVMGFVQHAAIVERRVCAVFSLEMAAVQLVMRMLASEGRIEGTRLRIGHIFDEDWPKLARAAGMISEAPIYIDDTGGATVEHIRGECHKLVAIEGKIGLIAIDYLQLMGSSNPKLSPEQVIAENSKSLKGLAKDFGCPVVLLSQLNRSLEQRQDKRPILSDARGSGAIEQDADVIIFVYRDVVYNPDTEHPNVAELIIAKQRNGPLGTARVAFLNEFTRFENLARDEGESWSPPRE